MRASFSLITVLLLIGCQAGTPPASEPDLVEPVTFSTWPSVTDGDEVFLDRLAFRSLISPARLTCSTTTKFILTDLQNG
jgi:hypothetical protein